MPCRPSFVCRRALSGGALALSLLAASCRLPHGEARAKAKQRDLLRADLAPAVPRDGIPVAQPVPGLSGYVFSPHLPGHHLIDARRTSPGALLLCPYTKRPMRLPTFPPPQPPKPAAPVPQRPPTPPQSLSIRCALPAPLAPSAVRIPGRPGFVYSPFASKNRLVDVANIAPGAEVKCPYTKKIFRVPPLLPEELAPPPAAAPPAPPEPAPPEPAPPEPAPVKTPEPAPAPAPEPAPAERPAAAPNQAAAPPNAPPEPAASAPAPAPAPAAAAAAAPSEPAPEPAPAAPAPAAPESVAPNPAAPAPTAPEAPPPAAAPAPEATPQAP